MPAPDIDDLLGPAGPLRALLPAFEHRPGQLELARGIAEVLESGGVLAAEAPTGIGKSLAYLIPAVLHALEHRVPVAVSTHTLNLQDQLLDKDVPVVAAALAARGAGEEPLRVAVVKGRANYLCRRRWDEARRGALDLAPGTLERLAGWVVDSETGDLGEAEAAVGPLGADRERLAADPATCAWGRCRRGDDCFLRRLRRRAATAHLVILNHALLFHHLLRDSAFLPDADALILDEAHHVERTLTEACGREVSIARVQALVGRALGSRARVDDGDEEDAPGEAEDLIAGGDDIGRLGELGRLAGRLHALPSDVDRLNLGRKIAASGERVRRAAGLVARGLRALASRLPVTADTPALRYGAEGAAELLGEEMPRARGAVAEAVSELQGLARAIDGLGPEAASAAPEEWLPGIAGLAAEWERLASDLDALASPGDGDVCWAQLERGAASLFSLPLAVSRAFAEKVLDRFRSTVLTSATLTVAGAFDHLVGRLGLDRRDRRRLHFMELESPFEHERQCVLLCDPGFPHPSAPGYGAAIARALESLIVRLPRRTMVLFTSNALLRHVHSQLAPVAAALGRPLLAQGVDGPRHALADRHRRDPGSVLLGTSSFWEGVDFPGEELEVLVITRLPFPVPGEPLIAARSEKLAAAGMHPFGGLFLPEAVLRFRQGFGRLIRSIDDRGAVICLDPRLLTASYGTVFARSLPVRPRVACGDALVESVAAWFDGALIPGAEPIPPRRRRGTSRNPRAAAAQEYAVDEIDLDEAVLERETPWVGRTFTRDDGSTIFIERLRTAEGGEEVP